MDNYLTRASFEYHLARVDFIEFRNNNGTIYFRTDLNALLTSLFTKCESQNEYRGREGGTV